MEDKTEYIIAYLEGRLPEEDKRMFEKQMLNSVEFRKEVDDLRFIYDAGRLLHAQEEINVEKRWNRVSSQMKSGRFRRKTGLFLRYAAAILLIPLLFSSIYLYVELKRQNNQPVKQVELSNAYGIISKVTLPDGSEVWLNSGSSLHYPQFFSDGQRKVSLTGEAYFKVSSDKKHRFDVELSNGLIVSAYGTEFNVSSYADDDMIRTTLAEGAVEIRNSSLPSPQILKPGEQAAYNKVTDNMQVNDVNLYLATSWKDGKMVFRRTSMQEIAQRLSRHFNVNIQLKSKTIYNYKYSATFTTETLEEILELLEKSAPIRCTVLTPEMSDDYSYTRKTVIIEAK